MIATIGAVISVMAFFVASAGDRFGSSSMTRSTFSTTTIASSTRIPIASTMASNEIVLAEKPTAKSTAKVPITLTGTAIAGMTVARRLPRNTKTTITTSTKAINSVISTSWISLNERWLKPLTRYLRPGGATLAQAIEIGFDGSSGLHRIRPRGEIDADRHRRRAVEAAFDVLVLGTEVDPGDIAYAQQGAVVGTARNTMLPNCLVSPGDLGSARSTGIAGLCRYVRRSGRPAPPRSAPGSPR